MEYWSEASKILVAASVCMPASGMAVVVRMTVKAFVPRRAAVMLTPGATA